MTGGVSWRSSDTTVAVVDSTGLVSTRASGTVYIRALRDAAVDSALLKVLPVPVAAVNVSPGADSLRQGQAVQLTAVAVDSVGNRLDRPLTWETSNSRVATVNSNGLVSARDSGTARIFATAANGRNGGAAITVTLVPVASVSVAPATSSIAAGASTLIRATPKDSAGNVLTGRATWYAHSNAAVAIVRSNGTVVGQRAGVDTITVTVETRSAKAIVTVSAPPAARPGWYASAGAPAGDGSLLSPWDLPTALAGGGGKVQPGDTIWVRGGTYLGNFRVTVGGISGRPVVVRQFPGERAIIDGVGTPEGTSIFFVAQPWVEVWDLEVTDSDPQRTSSSTAHDIRPTMVSNYAPHTRFVDLVVHDGGVGFYNDANQSDVEITGSIFYNIGWQGPDRGHGHGIYLRSNTGPVTAQGNVTFNQYGYGIHGFVDPGSQLDNISIVGNVSFNNGTLSNDTSSSNILLGGNDRATGDVLKDNVTYFSPGAGNVNIAIGYRTTANGSVTLTNNHFAGGTNVLWLGRWESVALSGNALAGPANLVTLTDSVNTGYSWLSTTYYRDPTSSAWTYLGERLPLLAWRAATGLGSSDQTTSPPSSPDVFVEPSPHASGRAVVAVYNWAHAGSISADMSAVLKSGDSYVVRNVQDLYGSPVVSGTYSGGSITIPISAVTPPVPVGLGSSKAPSTGTDFAVFVVSKQ